MNKMERELRRMFGESDIIYKAMYSGKTMIGMIDNDVRIKIEFANTKVSGKYDALKATVINRKDGVVDTTMFKFRDMKILRHIFDIILGIAFEFLLNLRLIAVCISAIELTGRIPV